MTASTFTFAGTHKDAAIHHINLTDLEVTFGITRDGVQKSIDDYQKRFLSDPSVIGNSEAEQLTQDFITQARSIAKEVYQWENVQELYTSALMETYSQEELENINEWLSSKYGKAFINNQKKFMLKTIDIGNSAAEQFQNRIRNIEAEYFKGVRAISSK
jgi:hypothetical protein